MLVRRQGPPPDRLLLLRREIDLRVRDFSPDLIVPTHQIQRPAPVSKVRHEPDLLLMLLPCEPPGRPPELLRVLHDICNRECELGVGQRLGGRNDGSVDRVEDRQRS
jgi:hypothetical protein